LVVAIVPPSALAWTVTVSSLFFLLVLGDLAAHAGGSPLVKAAVRVTIWRALATALTAGVEAMFGAVV